MLCLILIHGELYLISIHGELYLVLIKVPFFFATCKISKIFLNCFLNAKYTINSLFVTFYSKKQFWLNFARRKFSYYYFGKLSHVVKKMHFKVCTFENKHISDETCSWNKFSQFINNISSARIESNKTIFANTTFRNFEPRFSFVPRVKIICICACPPTQRAIDAMISHQFRTYQNTYIAHYLIEIT